MNRKRYFCTDFLFAKTSFLIGMGSVYNIAGNYFDFNRSNTETEADLNALRADWELVAKDLENAITSSYKESNSPIKLDECFFFE